MSARRPVIHVLGSLNLDQVSYVSHHPHPGETMTASGFESGCGGKGANQAVACAKLSRTRTLEDPSVDVFMIGAVGGDVAGSGLIESLASCGVDTSMVRVNASGGEDSQTGIAVIIIDESDGQNRIILSPGANRSVGFDHVQQSLSLKPDLLILQMEVPVPTVLDSIQAAKAANVPVLLNQAPAIAMPAEAYQGLNHLILNETEAALVADVAESELEDPSSLATVANRLLQKGVKNVVLTLGARGVFYTCESGERRLVPALKVDAIDTTAAGDTFIGAYAVAFAEESSRGEHFKVGDAVARAIRGSSITVSRRGAQTSIPWRNELEELEL
ncbi:Ribokinase like protein [Verticillium longisporum]|uniref:Ribokinase n=1 Tax=Verticillium longisporum TaxID=100787 RepID=A0A8I3AYT0_VERLO|nr:Ribokinase like protein [Verticillium longisporum]